MVIGVDDYPDVVLEVDHTTDVRRGKLAALLEQADADRLAQAGTSRQARGLSCGAQSSTYAISDGMPATQTTGGSWPGGLQR